MTYCRLIEDGRSLGIKAHGQECSKCFPSPFPQLGCILRYSQCVKVHDGEEQLGSRLCMILQLHPFVESTQIITQMRDSGRLNTGEDYRLLGNWRRARAGGTIPIARLN